MIALFVVVVLGLNFTVWGLLGLVRLVDDRVAGRSRRRTRSTGGGAIGIGDIAVLIPAHDEELVLGPTLAAASALVPVGDVYVVSDGSTDGTVAVAEAAGAHVLDLRPGRGKAGALTEGIARFGLLTRYRAVLLLDADTVLRPDYLAKGLPLFDDPDVVAVAGGTVTDWRGDDRSLASRFVLAHRDRVYLFTQLLVKFGQAWRRANVVHIVPGAASMYRVEALAQIELDAPNLVIEDFNMTFEVHHRGLGRIAFHPGVLALTQDPDSLGDYRRQVRRWCLGFWQTVRRHGFWPSRFCAALTLTVFDLVLSSLFFVTLPALLAVMVVGGLAGTALPWLEGPADQLGEAFPPTLLLLAVVVPDYLLTVVAAVLRRRPLYLVLGLGFLVMRVVDAGAALSSLPMAWRARSTGAWVSPARRPAATTEVASRAA